MADHMPMMTIDLMLYDFMIAAEDIASGRLARKTPTVKVISEEMFPEFARMPSTKDSGMASSPMPSQIMIAAFCRGTVKVRERE
jgi:hypothetical protein